MIEVTEVLGDVKFPQACTEITLFDGVCYLVLESLQEIKEMLDNDCDK